MHRVAAESVHYLIMVNWLQLVALLMGMLGMELATAGENLLGSEKQITSAPTGHVISNVNAWSPDSQWLVYDIRSDPAGDVFDGTRIERVNVATGVIQVLYESVHGSHCGVSSCNPVDSRIIFIRGPENPTPDWQYSACHRSGAIVDAREPGMAVTLDARDLTPPFTPGALRGGTHLHTFSADGQWIAFTYEDALLAKYDKPGADHDINQRNVGVSVPGKSVEVSKDDPRNHNGSYFTVLVTQTTPQPMPGSDEIERASEESWIGTNGYLKPDDSRQARAIAFQGKVVTPKGDVISEVFVVDIPDDVTVAGDRPLEGTSTRMPGAPRGTVQRRLTFTADRKYPGLQGPRHWMRSSPDGSQIAFLMRDDDGIVQLWTISPNGVQPRQVTHNSSSVASAFTWNRDGRHIAYIMDGSVFVTNVQTGQSRRIIETASDDSAPRPEACVFSPDGHKIAYVRSVKNGEKTHNQIFVAQFESSEK
jgi:WD40 repeat protein